MLFGRNRNENRRGAAVVELAVVAPLLIGMLLAMIEICRMYDTYNEMNTAARQGARLAAMDREGILQEGESTNDKILKDVKNFLAAAGFNTDADSLDVRICSPGHPETALDLDDPDNYLELFELRVEVPYGDTTEMDLPGTEDYSLVASVVFRNARGALVQ